MLMLAADVVAQVRIGSATYWRTHRADGRPYQPVRPLGSGERCGAEQGVPSSDGTASWSGQERGVQVGGKDPSAQFGGLVSLNRPSADDNHVGRFDSEPHNFPPSASTD